MRLPFRTDADVEAVAAQVDAHLRAGKLLAYPTETVYGLGSAASGPALDRLANLKGRAPGKPFLLLIDGLEMLEATGLVLDAHARVLAREFWPGPLTLVLRGGEGKLPDRLRGAVKRILREIDLDLGMNRKSIVLDLAERTAKILVEMRA